jgi:hypothetical protein
MLQNTVSATKRCCKIVSPAVKGCRHKTQILILLILVLGPTNYLRLCIQEWVEFNEFLSVGTEVIANHLNKTDIY